MGRVFTVIFQKLAEKFREKKSKPMFLEASKDEDKIHPEAKKTPKKRIQKNKTERVSVVQEIALSHQKVKLISLAGDIRLDPDNAESAFMARQLVQATLPHKNPGDKPAWSRKNGNLTLTIRPGWNLKKDKTIGYPYGTLPRLLLFWLRGLKSNGTKTYAKDAHGHLEDDLTI